MPLPRPLIIRLLGLYRPELAEPASVMLAQLAEGSIGRALELADADGIALYRSLLGRLSQVRRLDVADLHAFADQLARPEAEDLYRTVQELLSQFLARMIAHASRGKLDANDLILQEADVMRQLAACADPGRWVRLREEIDRSFVDTDQLNLDRKQAVLGAFFAIEEIAR
jgi:DNA polymerase-3 subunit delta'